MKILGLEIRAITETKTIYDHVDSTLAEAQIAKGSVSLNVQVSAVAHALHCMHWNEMLPDFRKTIVAMILDDFRAILNPESEPVECVVLTNEGGVG